METMIWKGLTEKGVWEEFAWDDIEKPTPESTGYEKIIKA